MAGVNHWNNQEKQEKKLACITRIYELIEKEKIDATDYSYLIGYKRLVDNMLLETGEETMTIQKILFIILKKIMYIILIFTY